MADTRGAERRQALRTLLEALEGAGLEDTLLRERVADFLYLAVVLGQEDAVAGPFGRAPDTEARVCEALQDYAESVRPMLGGLSERERAGAVWDYSVETADGTHVDDVAGAI